MVNKTAFEKQWKFCLTCDDVRDVGDIIQYSLYADAHFVFLPFGKISFKDNNLENFYVRLEFNQNRGFSNQVELTNIKSSHYDWLRIKQKSKI